MTAVHPAHSPLRRSELLLLALIAAGGFALRAAYPERMAIEHFDEGVYASNWYCALQPGGVFPNQHLYAPPLFPGLLYYVLFFSGGDPHAVMWVNVVLGSLMVPLVWWIARDWFGPTAGLVAATLCAASDVHIFFSRAALTDVPLCLFLTAGVWTGTKAILTGRPTWIVLGALFAALAWWTKYNGWLTLAITGAGLAGWLLFARPKNVRPGPLLLRWLATALLAFALWSPVLWQLQDHGGYAAVARNHAGYFVGVAGWWSSLRQYISDSWQIDSVIGVAGATLTLSLATVWVLQKAHPDWLVTVVVLGIAAGFVAGSASVAGTFVPLLLLAMVGTARTSLSLGQPADGGRPADGLPGWVLAAWLVGLLVSAPMYTPYPRLILPLVVASWLGAGALIESLRVLRLSMTWRTLVSALLLMLASGIALGLGRHLIGSKLVSPKVWEPHTSRIATAKWVAETIAADSVALSAEGIEGRRAVVYVEGDPALFYHLSAMESAAALRYFVQPLADLSVLSANETDPRLVPYVAFETGWRPLDEPTIETLRRHERIGTERVISSALVTLDNANAADADWRRLWLYRLNR